MYLKRLEIRSLPGIEPGLTFTPPGTGVNVVTGPNAIGKSSLERALGYLLRGARKGDPVALSLEAELVAGETTWRVLRNGSQLAWYRDGSPASAPAVPGADQTGLYRLSIEQLLAGDKHDLDLARELRNRLRGGFDLEAPRLALGLHFARAEERKLSETRDLLRQAQGEYEALARQEQEELPRLNQEIEATEAAQERLHSLQLGLELDKAINVRKSRAEEVKAYPPGMDRLRGDERTRLADPEEKAAALQEKLRGQERRLHDADAALEKTGLEQSAPESEDLEAVELCLQQLRQKAAGRKQARDVLVQADAVLTSAREPFNDTGKPPRLDAQGLGQAEAIAVPLLKARSRREALQQELDQAGQPPDETEINKLYEAGGALREWLAAHAVESGSRPAPPDRWLRIALWVAPVASGLAALLAWIQQVLPAAITALVAFGAATWCLLFRRRRGGGTSADELKRRFFRTGLSGPPDWSRDAVEEHLRTGIESPYNTLVLHRERALQAAGVPIELERVETEIAELQARRQDAAATLGFNPELPSLSPDIFLQHCHRLLEAENRQAAAKAGLETAARDVAADLARVRDFLSPWHNTAIPVPEDADEEQDINLLQVSFQALKRRVTGAQEARRDIKHHQESIRSIQGAVTENQDATRELFAGCGLEPGNGIELDKRLGLLAEWQVKREAVRQAKFTEDTIRARLESHPEIIRQVEAGRVVALQSSYDAAKQQAGEHGRLLEQRTEITTRLKDAGADHKLGQARAAVDSAKVALQDKREQAWLFEATGLLLDDVEQTYQAEHVPPTLRRAQDLFKAITHGAFELQLDKDGEFSARDLQQNALRRLLALSSGTRMQLLLALRLAWVEAQEQDGETLPLFLDEALTTSDEDRFAVMANSLEQLAADRKRQIFYLSARRHERALWQQATGTEPAVIDLAEVRFPRAGRPPQDYAITTPAPLPSPQGQDPASYASTLGVPLPDPRREPGTVHLFHLLRDNLELLYRLMETWHINSLGQLESLLNSDAAVAAITDDEIRGRLRLRCVAVRTWAAYWRQGRGRPVDRIALEQSDAVSETFIDRVTDLAESLNGDGKALAAALREGQVSGFRAGKIEQLKRWLADQGYTTSEEILCAQERRRLTLQQAASIEGADTGDVNEVITRLESASRSLLE